MIKGEMDQKLRRKYEMWYLTIGICAISLLWIIRFFFNHALLHIEKPHFLFIHTLLESISIFAAFAIFIQAVVTSPSKKNASFFIGIIFLMVGSFDLLHTFFYKGMPFYDDEFTVNRATYFWIAARLTEGIGILLAVLLPYKLWTEYRRGIVFIALIMMSIVSSGIFFKQDRLPTLIDNVYGITGFKILLEYIICSFMLWTFIILIRRYKKNQNIDTLRLAFAVSIIMIGELFFTIYETVYDAENLIGHLYKFAGYVYLFRAIFFPQIQLILTEKEKAETKWREAKDMLFEVEKNLSQLVLQAHEEERKRVSRELHDGIGQSLYSILMTLNVVDHEIATECESKSLQKAKKMTADAMIEVKGIAHSLRPSSLDDLGFVPALRTYLENFEGLHRVVVKLEIIGRTERFDSEIETALYRICQETLTNSAKYAQASSIGVSLEIDTQEVHLTIKDDGVGFSMENYFKGDGRKGIGLFSMRERVEALGGEYTIKSELDKGTTTTVSVPKSQGETAHQSHTLE